VQKTLGAYTVIAVVQNQWGTSVDDWRQHTSTELRTPCEKFLATPLSLSQILSSIVIVTLIPPDCLQGSWPVLY